MGHRFDPCSAYQIESHRHSRWFFLPSFSASFRTTNFKIQCLEKYDPDRGGRRDKMDARGMWHVPQFSGQWSVAGRQSLCLSGPFHFHSSPLTRMWHVPHLGHPVFCRAEMGVRERAFDLRGTRFWRFVARLEGVKNGSIWGQNDTCPPDSTCFSDESALPTHPDPIRRCSEHLRYPRER